MNKINSKSRIGILLIVIIIFSALIPLPFVRANWLSSWDYRKFIELTGSSVGVQTNYQVGVKVYYGAGTDGTEVIQSVTFSKIYVNSKCQTDFDDIRFTETDGDTELDYFLLSKTDSNNAIFWVEVDTIPVDPNTVNIYIYYGNAGVSTTSNGDNTFLLYDHFDDNSLDLGKWAKFEYGNGVTTEPVGTNVLLDVHPAVTSDNAGITSVATFTSSFTVLIKRKQLAENRYYIAMSFGAGGIIDGQGEYSRFWQLSLRSGYWFRFYYTSHATSIIYRCPVSGIAVPISSGAVTWTSCAQYAIWEMRYDQNGKLTWKIDGITRSSEPTDNTFIADNKNILINQGSYSGGNYGADTIVDYVIVRKYVNPEPTHTDWGSEEVAPYLFNRSIEPSDATVYTEQWFFLNVTIKITEDTSDFNISRIDIDPTGLNLSCRYKNSTDTFIELNDPSDYLSIDDAISEKIDINSTDVRVNFYIHFHHTITKEGLYNVKVYSSTTDDLDDTDTFNNVFTLTIRKVVNRGIIPSDSTPDDEQWFFLNVTIKITEDTSDFNISRIDIDPTGLNLSCRYNNSTDTFIELNDPNNYLSIDDAISEKIDVNSSDVRVNFYIHLHHTITKVGLYNVTTYSTASVGLSDKDTFEDVFTLTIRSPSAPTLLFGAGFNTSIPYVELHWTHNLLCYSFFEVQNSSNAVDYTYLGQNTTTQYLDTAVLNGTNRYYRVRTCRNTGVGYKNSTFTSINFEKVYFVVISEEGESEPLEDYAGLFIVGIILGLAVGLGASKI